MWRNRVWHMVTDYIVSAWTPQRCLVSRMHFISNGIWQASFPSSEPVAKVGCYSWSWPQDRISHNDFSQKSQNVIFQWYPYDRNGIRAGLAWCHAVVSTKRSKEADDYPSTTGAPILAAQAGLFYERNSFVWTNAAAGVRGWKVRAVLERWSSPQKQARCGCIEKQDSIFNPWALNPSIGNQISRSTKSSERHLTLF